MFLKQYIQKKSFPNVVNGTRTSQTSGNKTLTRKNVYLYLTIDANNSNFDALNVNIRFFTNYGQRYRNTNTGMNSPYEGAGYTLYRK